MKEIKDDINRWGDIPCSWVGRINIVKMAILPNAVYRFNAIPIILPIASFTELEQKNFTIHMETQKTPNSQSNLQQEQRSWKNQPSWLYNKTRLQNNMVLAQKQKYRPMEQDRKPREKPMHLWAHYLWQRRQEYTMGKDSLFNKWYWENWTAMCRRMKLEYFLTLLLLLLSHFNRVWLCATP